MQKIDRGAANSCILLCAFVYLISYITRNNYSVIVSEMVTSTGLAKSDLAPALAGIFLTYGVGQLVSGYFGDRIQPKHLILGGLGMSVGMNVLIPLCTQPWQMTLVWCLNGLAQAFMWPPLVKLMSAVLTEADYRRGSLYASWGGSLGTIALYLTAPALIWLAGWKSVFFFAALMGLAGMVLWRRYCPVIEMSLPAGGNAAPGEKELSSGKLILGLLMTAIMLQGILRDGVASWMPSYIVETYRLSNETAILTGVLMPLFSIVSSKAAAKLYSQRLTNPLTCASVIYAFAMVVALLLRVFSQSGAVASILLAALLTGSMHGVNLILICMVPPLLAQKGKVSTVSGWINAAAYAGSGISAYLIPLATENAGWNATITLWLGCAVMGTAACVIGVPLWKKRTANKQSLA